MMLCRNCTLTTRNAPDAPRDGSNQLSLGGHFAPRLNTPSGMLGYQPPHWKALELAKARRPAPAPVSQHLVDRHQLELITPVRDWSRIDITTGLPSLTPDAAAVLDVLLRRAREAHWSEHTLATIQRTLRILLSWLGSEAPIQEEDVLALSSDHRKTTARRVLPLLAEAGLLIPARRRATTADQRWIEAQLDLLSPVFAAELEVWVHAMRGQGRRRHRIRRWEMIRKYLLAALPSIRRWSKDHQSLREITDRDIDTAMHGLTGAPAHTLRTALRSIFRTLKHERVIFRDPTRGIVLARVQHLPIGLHHDQLRGLLDRIDTPFGQIAVALVAVHALTTTELRTLLITDVDLGTARIVVHRGRTRTIYLDELCLKLLVAWLRERQLRWPTSPNPHLLLTAHNAFALNEPAIGHSTLAGTFRSAGIQARHLRADRILYEATTTADPIHLMRTFRITAATAMRYVNATHPHRAGQPPRH